MKLIHRWNNREFLRSGRKRITLTHATHITAVPHGVPRVPGPDLGLGTLLHAWGRRGWAPAIPLRRAPAAGLLMHRENKSTLSRKLVWRTASHTVAMTPPPILLLHHSTGGRGEGWLKTQRSSSSFLTLFLPLSLSLSIHFSLSPPLIHQLSISTWWDDVILRWRTSTVSFMKVMKVYGHRRSSITQYTETQTITKPPLWCIQIQY